MATAKSENLDRSEELEATREAARAALENLIQAKEHFKKAAEAAGLDAKHEAQEKFHRGRDKAEAVGEQLSEAAINCVVDKPLTTLGIAFLGGFLIAQLMGRR